MIRAHAAAIEQLTADAGPPIFNGEVDGEPEVYVVFYLSAPAAGPKRRLSLSSPKSMLMLSTLARGGSPNECAWAVEKLHAALVGRRLNVSGRICDPFLPPESPAEIRYDDSIQPPAWVCTEAWPFYTSPTP